MLEQLHQVDLLSNVLLFGERTALGRLPASTGGSSVSMLIGLGLGALFVMGVIVALVQYRQRRNTKGSLNSPTELWAELCRVHQLDKTDSAALSELAQARAIVPAAGVFVRADLWKLDADTVEIRHLRPQLQRLHSLLFAGPEPVARAIRL